MRSDTGRVEVVGERLAGSGPFTVSDVLEEFCSECLSDRVIS
jgi:hypothetical protein